MNTGIANHHAISLLYEMLFCYRSNVLYIGKPTSIIDYIIVQIVQTIIPLLGYSIPKGVLENAGTGNRRYWRMPVL